MVKFELNKVSGKQYNAYVWSMRFSARIGWYKNKSVPKPSALNIYENRQDRIWFWRWGHIALSFWIAPHKLKFKKHNLDYGKYSGYAIGTVVKNIKKGNWGWVQMEGLGKYVS